MAQQVPPPPLTVGSIDAVPAPILIPYKILERQDWVRSITTIAFVSVFGLTVILSFIMIYLDRNWTNTKELIQTLLPAETALLGSALGFYFGAKTTSSNP